MYEGTYGSTNNRGRAVSWIFEGALKPIQYTPFKSSGALNEFKQYANMWYHTITLMFILRIKGSLIES